MGDTFSPDSGRSGISSDDSLVESHLPSSRDPYIYTFFFLKLTCFSLARDRIVSELTKSLRQTQAALKESHGRIRNLSHEAGTKHLHLANQPLLILLRSVVCFGYVLIFVV